MLVIVVSYSNVIYEYFYKFILYGIEYKSSLVRCYVIFSYI